jgi:hypothetical protein
MTSDGNHPTLAGSYLYALLLYGDLSYGEIAKVTFVPSGLSPQTATVMKDAIARYLPMGSEYRGTLAFIDTQGRPLTTQ